MTRTIENMTNTTATRRGPKPRSVLGATLLSVLLTVTTPWAGTARASNTGETGTPLENPPTTPEVTPPGTSETGTPPRSEPAPETGSDEHTKRSWRKVVVDLSDQELTVHDQHGKVILTWGISSGAPKTPTPVGTYRASSKSRRTFALGNPEVTMEHMVRFKGSIGFHSIPRLNGTPLWTPLGERGVSHGCIRMADVHARTLYRNLPLGAVVVIKP